MSASTQLRAPRAPPSAAERVLRPVLLGCVAASAIVTLALSWVLGRGTVQLFAALSPAQFMLGPVPVPPHAGLAALVAGTVSTSIIALAVAVPLGVLAAIYLAEFAGPRLRRALEPTFETLAGIPTVVYGFFALVFLTPVLRVVIPGLPETNALSPGLVMGVMIAPMIASHGAAALRAVPRSLREGAWALGAGEAQTIFTIVLPLAAPGIAAAAVLALSRALGETMIVAMAAGWTPALTLDPRASVETMSAFVVHSAGSPEVLVGHGMVAVGAGLFAITALTNLAARRLSARGRGAGA